MIGHSSIELALWSDFFLKNPFFFFFVLDEGGDCFNDSTTVGLT